MHTKNTINSTHESNDVSLLHIFHQCSHHLHASKSSHGQERLLIHLLEKGTLTQRELTEITRRRSATLSEQLETMDKAGYIIRTRNEHDRRNVDVSLTPLGEETAKKARDSRIRRANILFSPLSADEKEQLFRLLRKLLIVWEKTQTESEEDNS